jgi:3-oxoacyl-[acyl-carrier protein] reductase
MTAETQDRIVAITGAGRGLGLLTVRTLLEQGAQVLANHRSPSEELSQLRKQYQGRLHLFQGDISEEEAASEFAAEARNLGRMDALVCNAGIWTTSRSRTGTRCCGSTCAAPS